MSSYYSPQYKVDREQDNPQDTVTQITFNPFLRGTYSFLVSSWDGFVRSYTLETVGSSKQINKQWEYFFQHPVLSCDITSQMFVIAGLASGEIVMVDMNTNNSLTLGSHQAPICRLFWCQQHGIVISLGYDNWIRCFNFQSINNSFMRAQFKLPAKTVTTSFSFPYLLIGSNEGKIALISFQNPQNLTIPNQYNSIDLNPLSKLISSSIFSEDKRIALGTADGLFIFTQFSDSNYNGIKIEKAIVCKQQKRSSYHSSLMGQVNTVDLNCRDRKSSFCVYGGTQETGLHDVVKNKKLKNITNSLTITQAKISPDCQYLVYASGTDWLKGIDDLDGSKKCKLLGIKLTTSDLY